MTLNIFPTQIGIYTFERKLKKHSGERERPKEYIETILKDEGGNNTV